MSWDRSLGIVTLPGLGYLTSIGMFISKSNIITQLIYMPGFGILAELYLVAPQFWNMAETFRLVFFCDHHCVQCLHYSGHHVQNYRHGAPCGLSTWKHMRSATDKLSASYSHRNRSIIYHCRSGVSRHVLHA
jgi:hypothetical protein